MQAKDEITAKIMRLIDQLDQRLGMKLDPEKKEKLGDIGIVKEFSNAMQAADLKFLVYITDERR